LDESKNRRRMAPVGLGKEERRWREKIGVRPPKLRYPSLVTRFDEGD
jgi:hypothetical protein